MSRRTQPYRKGPRPPGQALNAMLKGRTSSGWNPKDSQRNAQRLMRAGKQQMRPQRPDRPARPDRPPRLASTASTDAQSGGGYRGIGKGTYRGRPRSVGDGVPDWKAPVGSKRYIPRRRNRPIPRYVGKGRGWGSGLGPPEQRGGVYRNARSRKRGYRI